MSVYFDKAGMKAESLCAKQFGITLTSDTKHQYVDIDGWVKGKDGVERSVSVKDQLWSSGVYKAIQIETKLVDSRTGASVDGCFVSCEADFYFWRVTTHKGDTWAIVEVSKMQAYVEQNKLKEWRTSAKTEAKNRSYGRKYDRAMGVVVPIDDLVGMATLIKVKGV